MSLYSLPMGAKYDYFLLTKLKAYLVVGLELLQRLERPVLAHPEVKNQRVYCFTAARQISGRDCVSLY